MSLFIYIVLALIIVVSTVFNIIFVMVEGKDERGQSILAKASQIALPFTSISIVFQMFYIRFSSPTFEQIEISILIIMAVIWATNSLSIYILKRRT